MGVDSSLEERFLEPPSSWVHNMSSQIAGVSVRWRWRWTPLCLLALITITEASVRRFPASTLITREHGASIAGWITESDPDTDPNQVWTRCYQMSLDSKGIFDTEAENFHAKCDNKGPTVTVAKLSTGKVVGGYAGVSWETTTGFKSSPSSFLFSLSNGFQYNLTPGQEAWAHYFSSDIGPAFGPGSALKFYSDFNSGECNLGRAYQCRVGAFADISDGFECQNDFCGDHYSGWTVDELEVWHVDTGNVGHGTADPISKLDVRGRVSVMSDTQTQMQLGTADTCGWLEAWDPNSGASRSPKRAMGLNPWGGNVGVGTLNPAHLLHLKSGGSFAIGLQSTHANVGQTFSIGVSDPSGTVGSAGSGIGFSSASVDRGFFFREDGNVGIGTTTPPVISLQHCIFCIITHCTSQLWTRFSLLCSALKFHDRSAKLHVAGSLITQYSGSVEFATPNGGGVAQDSDRQGSRRFEVKIKAKGPVVILQSTFLD